MNNLNNKVKKVSKIYDRESRIYDKDRFGNRGGRYYFKMQAEVLIKFLKKGSILEIGTGTAQYPIFLAKNGFNNITGIDISKGMIDKAKCKIKQENLEDKIKLAVMDAHHLSFSDEKFDNVISIGGFRFLGPEALKEAYRVLKKNGRIIIICQSGQYLYNFVPRWRQTSAFSEGVYRVEYTLKEMEGMFKKIGFNIVLEKSLFILPPAIYYRVPQFILNIVCKFDDKFKRGRLLIIGGEKI